jgi:tetratricopeptide (TPR) repeat protein
MKKMQLMQVGLIMFGIFLVGCASTASKQEKMLTPSQTVRPATTPVPAPVRTVTAEDLAAAREAEIAKAKAAAAREPQNWRVFSDLGTVYCRQGRYDQAVAAFQQALALHATTTILETEKQQADAQAAQRAAMQAKREADMQRAKALQSQQEMNEIFGLIGGIAGVQGNMQGQMLAATMQTMNNQIGAVPNDVPPLSPELRMESSLKSKSEVAALYISLGSAYFGKKDYQQVVTSLDNALQLDPSRTEVLKTSAEAQYYLCKYDECIITFAKYHAIAPVETASLLRLCNAYRALGMEAEADKAFTAFLAKSACAPDDAVKLLQNGVMCLSQWRYQDALESLTKAQQVANASPEKKRFLAAAQVKQFQTPHALFLLLAEAQFNLQHTQQAIDLLQAFIAEDNTYPKAWYMLAQCYDEAGAADKANEAYGKALETFNAPAKKAPAPDYIQVCRAAKGEGDAAIKALETQLLTIPLTPGGGVNQWCVLAFAFEKAGRIPEAIEIFNRCCDVSPAYFRARLALSRIEKQIAPKRKQLLAEAETALAAKEVAIGMEKLAEVYRLTASGKEKEKVRKSMLQLAAGLEPALAMSSSAQDRYLRGSVALKAAKNPMDLGRSLSEFQWSVFYSPWVGDLYFNTSAVKKLQNQATAAVHDLKLYLTGKPSATNVSEILNRLYEFDYQHEQKLRELAAVSAF